MLRLAFDFIITWRETRTRPNAYRYSSTAIVWKTCMGHRTKRILRIERKEYQTY